MDDGTCELTVRTVASASRTTEYRANAGELRIYLGAAPGVGKTFAMLGEAHRRLERGTDLVAAVVETHGRKKTAELLDGIEVIPPRYIEYRGSTLPRTRRARGAGPPPAGGAGRRAGPHQHPGQQEPQALAGRRGAARRRHHRDLHGQRPAPGEPQRRRRPDHRHRTAGDRARTRWCAAPRRSNWSTSRRKRCGAGCPTATSTRRNGSTRRCPTTSDSGNLTALRELALLWLADQVDAALAKYRADNKITDTWEARERVVVAVTGGPESETLVRRASRIASKSSAELMVVHVVRGDGLAGVSAPQMGKVRELATSLGATLHTVVGDDVPTALLDFAREMNATQLVLGTSRRSRWARIFDEGIGAHSRAAVRQDRRAHGHPRGGQARVLGRRRSRPRERRLASWLAALVVPSAICAVTVLLLDRFLGIGGESALFFVGVLVVALLGGVAPAALSAVLSGLLLNYFLDRPAPQLHHRRTRQRRHHRGAAGGRGRGRRAGRRRRQPRPGGPACVAGGRTAGAVRRVGAARRRPDTLLERVRETYSQRAVSMLREHDGDSGRSSPAWATTPASTSIPPTPRSRSATTSSGC